MDAHHERRGVTDGAKQLGGGREAGAAHTLAIPGPNPQRRVSSQLSNTVKECGGPPGSKGCDMAGEAPAAFFGARGDHAGDAGVPRRRAHPVLRVPCGGCVQV